MTTITNVREFGVRAHAPMLVAPLLAMMYPFLLQGYSQAVHVIVLEGVAAGTLPWLLAAVFLLAALTVPGVALVFAMKFSQIETPTILELRAKQAALLAVAAPPLFTCVGVVLYMLGDPVPDKWILVVFWAVVLASVLRGGHETAAAPTKLASSSLRKAHGISALAIIVLFLAVHISNQLVGLAGPGTHAAVQKTLRLIYRSAIVEPVLVGLFVFQIVSGFYLVWRLSAGPSDLFRTFQIASGIYVAGFLVSHMNAVFIFARTYLGIDTGWGFATGAPAGLLKDPWNIRLVPLYTFSVFFVLSHIAGGTRIVLLNHGINKTLADGLAIVAAAISGTVAVVIILGMCGLHL